MTLVSRDVGSPIAQSARVNVAPSQKLRLVPVNYIRFESEMLLYTTVDLSGLGAEFHPQPS